MEEKAYSVRVDFSGGEKALSALGILRKRAKPDPGGPQYDLEPVGLPTLDTQGGQAVLPAKWRGAFAGMRWDQVLTAYIDGYEPFHTAHGPQVGLRSGTFLATAKPASFDPAQPIRYYAWFPLSPALHRQVTEPIPLNLQGGPNHNEEVLKVAGGRFLLGRRLTRILDHAAWTERPPLERTLYVRGFLRVLGIEGRAADMPTGKKHEIFIPDPEPDALHPERDKPRHRLPIPAHVLDTFCAIGRERAHETRKEPDPRARHPFTLAGIDHWEPSDGDLVYFDLDADGQVCEISISAIWRRKVGDRSKPGIQTSYHFFDALAAGHLLTPLRPAADEHDKARPGLTPAELLFGVVESGKADDDRSAKALASRLRFFDAAPLAKPAQASQSITLKTLSSPKPPSPALYFRPGLDPGGYIAKGALDKDMGHRPNGRKFYLHHPDAGFTATDPRQWDCTSHAGDGRDHLRLSCRPLLPEPENPFYFHIDFDNLTDRELTLLVTALKPSAAYRHKLGLGKSLGLGTVQVEVLGVLCIDRTKRYGLDALDQPRYHYGWRPAPGALNSQLDQRYPQEALALGKASGPDWHTQGATDGKGWWKHDLIDAQALGVLCTIGDPAKLVQGAQVHTPLTTQQRPGTGADREKETFQWFVANDKTHHQALAPVTAGAALPTLPYLPRHAGGGG